MPAGRMLLLRQRRHNSNKDKDGAQLSPNSPNSPASPSSPDTKGQRFFGTSSYVSNMPKKRSQSDSNGNRQNYELKPPGKQKHSKPENKNWLTVTRIVIIISCSIASFSFMLYQFDLYFNSSKRLSKPGLIGGWRLADDITDKKYATNVCNVDQKQASELTTEEFEKVYRFKRPVIVKFKNGSSDWTNPEKWTLSSLKKNYSKWVVMSGNSREIVRRGGTGNIDSTFSKYVDKMMNQTDSIGEPFYVFDRQFYNDSDLPRTLKMPPFLEIKDGIDDSIFFLGSSASGVSFHKHADAWNGVIYGRKRWFLYPVEKTPPGGVYPGFTTLEWYDQVLPKLPKDDMPLQCIQEPGEILYLPEGMYHATINLGDTIAVGIQKKLATTQVEKLFYEEHEITQNIPREKHLDRRKNMLTRKREIYEALIDHLPDNAEVHMKAGQMYKEQGDLNSALKQTEIAIKLDTHFVVAVLNLADIYSQLGHVDKAEQFYRQARFMNPRLWDVYAQYGDFLINHNRPEEAAIVYKKGIELEPDSLAFWNHLKLAQERAGDSAAAEETQKAINKMKRERR